METFIIISQQPAVASIIYNHGSNLILFNYFSWVQSHPKIKQMYGLTKTHKIAKLIERIYKDNDGIGDNFGNIGNIG